MDETNFQDKWARKAARWEARQARWQARGPYRSGAGGVVIGGIVIAVGSLLLLQNLGIVRTRELWDFWPLALVAWGVAKIVECRRPSSTVWGAILIVAGSGLFLDKMGLFDFPFLSWNMLWPGILIAVGIGMLFRATERQRFFADGMPGPEFDAAGAGPAISLNAVFSGGRRRYHMQDFRGGEINAVFGGFNVDLRGAKMAGDKALLEINAVFGGVDLFVPANWKVTTKGAGVFGAFEDKTLQPPAAIGAENPELIVTGAAVFGGVNIRN